MRENIAFGAPWATDDDVSRAAERAQAAEFIESLPDGYDTQIGERGLTLSGGQRQRIAIARALLVDPRILILDDATAAVDATTEAKIKRALQEVMRGRTTIIIAHRLSTISLAERVIVMDRGRIVADGTHEELAESSELYGRIRTHGLLDRTFVDLDGDRYVPPKEGDTAVGHPRARGAGLARPVSMNAVEVPEQRASLGRGIRRIRRLAVYLRPSTGRVVIGVIGMLVATAAALTAPYLAKVAIDDAIVPADLTALAWIVAAFLAVSVIGFAGQGVQTYQIGYAGERILTDLRGDLFGHLQGLELGFYERNRAGVLISRLTNDIEALQQLVTDGAHVDRPEHR